MSIHAFQIVNPIFRAFDNDGNKLAFGEVWTYEKNSTTVLKTTWYDAEKKKPNTNPVILDAEGAARIYLEGDYHFVVKDPKGCPSEIWQKTVSDPVTQTIANLYTETIDTLRAEIPTGNGFVNGQVMHVSDNGTGGLFYWNSTSKLADNNFSVIKPYSSAPSAKGRWIRQQINISQPMLAGSTLPPTYIKKIAAYDENGNLIGYIPIIA